MDIKERFFSFLNLSPDKRLPSFKGIIDVKHYIKGRIRLLIPLLKNNKAGGEALLKELKKLPQLKSLRLTDTTGSLLIEFDEAKITAPTVISILIRLLALEEEINRLPKGMILNEADQVSRAINRAIYEKSKGLFSTNSLLFTGFVAFGLYQMTVNKMRFPPALTMLWWAYNMLNKGQR